MPWRLSEIKPLIPALLVLKEQISRPRGYGMFDKHKAGDCGGQRDEKLLVCESPASPHNYSTGC